MDRREVGTEDPFTEVTGNAHASRLLRSNLEVIADQHRESPLGRLVSDVLAGRRPLRDLQADAAFMELTRDGVQQYRDYLATLTPEERQSLERQGRDLAD